MSVSGLWDTLAALLTSGVLLVDWLRPVLLWLCLALSAVYLFALALWVLNRLENGDSDAMDATSCHRPSSLHDRLDQMAMIAVSRRPQTRKRRHRHHAH
jgi:hypothetical protein